MDKAPARWHIKYNPKPIPIRAYDYDFWHDDHDGENGLCGEASSIEDAIRQIGTMDV